MMLTAKAGGQSKPMPRFRRQTRAQFKPSRRPKMFSWAGPDAALTMQSERTGIENKWYALKGRVVELKVEEDGDLHVALHDGARFAQRFLVGLQHGFLFTLALRRS